MFNEYHAHEIVTATERNPRNALKFGTSGEVYSKEGRAQTEGLILLQFAPPNCSEAETTQGELNRALGEALILQPSQQRLRTKLVFDDRIDNQFLD